ncbi:MAG TPA: helicase-related protein [Ktedonobacteraceae bacterium]|nr:helicase-related protein [Ktedonobacteraceae bacterium]
MVTNPSYSQPSIGPLHEARRFLDLLAVVDRLQQEERPATESERALLSAFMGWGPLSRAFEPTAEESWQEIGQQIILHLGPDGYEDARAATPHSFFTDPLLVETIWNIARTLGFEGGQVLEPGCGSGHFMSSMPADLDCTLIGIEREPFSAGLARLRFPEATIHTLPLEKVAIARESIDLVVGNVPFADIKIYDRQAPVKFSLHNYFLWRAIQALRPGGLALLITSRYTLDAKDATQRQILSEDSILLGAIRLPSGAHKAARTEAVTDILVLQRRSSQIFWDGHPWMGLSDNVLEGISLNEYFDTHPEMIIGIPYLDHGLYRDNELKVLMPQDFAHQLRRAVLRLGAELAEVGVQYLPPQNFTSVKHLVQLRSDGRKEGSYHLIDGRLVQIVDGEAQPVRRNTAELTALVHLRDAALALLEAERDLDTPDEALSPLRQALNRHYDAYLRVYGPIHRGKLVYGKPDEQGRQSVSKRKLPAISAFSHDPDYPVVLGLEDYDPATEKAAKVEIFHRRIHCRPEPRTRADTADEALAICLDQHGELDLEVVAELLSLPLEEVPSALGDLAYEDPQEPGAWIVTAEYLSGNVRTKLKHARRASETDSERFSRNVAALEHVMPEDLAPEEIRVNLGAPWIPVGDIARFCSELLSVREPTVTHERVTGTWEIRPGFYGLNPAVTSEWGTNRMDAFSLIEKGLNQQTPIIYDTNLDGSRTKNAEETTLVQEKLAAIKERFSTWVWEDAERTTRLCALYNQLFRSTVPRKYDGCHLSFPGMSEEWRTRIYPWQRDFIYQMTCSLSALCGFPVGAGKTTIQVAGAMTLKRLGLTRKAAIIVPNHLLEQITAEAQRLYPSARILMVGREELSAERRKIFAARVAMGDYDFVVMTHSGFGALPVHPETERLYLEKRIAAYRQTLVIEEEKDERGSGRKSRSVKRIEAAIEKMVQRQTQLLDKERDEGVTFEQLGITCILMDELHLFKNLGLPTNIQSLTVEASKRAVDLEMKLRWLEEHNRGKPFGFGFTATPLSNSMVEAFVMAWFLRPRMLQELGMETVDAFAALYIEFENAIEISPNGATFQMRNRPSRFINLPEFQAWVAQFSDIRDDSMLDAKRPTKLEHTIVLDPTQEMQTYVDTLVDRSEKIHAGYPKAIRGKEDNMLWVTTDGRKAALTLTLVGRTPAREPKLEAVVKEMATLFERMQKDAARLPGKYKSLQIGFCDLGTPNAEEGDQVYGLLKQRLVRQGMPADAIRFIHEAKTDAAKAVLFQQCRSGDVAVLLGSTAKLGTGTNIQSRCIAIHHIDAPWRPDEVQQRVGRGHRPGNVFSEVHIYTYVQKRTFDAFTWQTLYRKAKFFQQMVTNQGETREMEDLGEVALSFGQVKAAATGDPLLLEQAEQAMAITRLQRLQNGHSRARYRDRQEAGQARTEARALAQQMMTLQKLCEREANSTRKGLMPFRGELLTDPLKAGTRLAKEVERITKRGPGQEWIGHFCEISLRILVQPDRRARKGRVDVFLALGDSHDDGGMVLVEVEAKWMFKANREAFIQALTEVFTNASSQIGALTAQKEETERRATQYEAAAATPFAHAEELKTRLARKAALDAYVRLGASLANERTEAKVAELEALRAKLLEGVPIDLITLLESPALAEEKDSLLNLESETLEPPVEESDARWSLDAEESEEANQEELFAPVIMALRGDMFVPVSLFDDDALPQPIAPLPVVKQRRRAKKRRTTHPWLSGGKIKEARLALFDLDELEKSA